jgi:hypothetical protein
MPPSPFLNRGASRARRLRRIKIDLITSTIAKIHPTHGTGRRSAKLRRLIAGEQNGRAGRGGVYGVRRSSVCTTISGADRGHGLMLSRP